MTFSLIVCTLGERKFELERLIDSLNNQIFKDFEVVFLSQRNHLIVEAIITKAKFVYKHIKLNKEGLSYSRNESFKYITGEYITISDDDCWYFPESLDLIKTDIEKRKEQFSAFSFKIYDPINNIPFKNNYLPKEKHLNKFDILHCSSIEIFFHNSISKNIRFDERFGVGSLYPSGEENIFLADLLRKKNKICFIPIDIVYHKARNLTHKKFDNLFMKSKFYIFQRMYGNTIGIFLYYIFYIKKINNIENKRKALLPFLS